MRIAIAHLTLKLMSKKQNFDKIKKAVQEAKVKGAKTVILPPMLNVGPVLSFFGPAQCRSIIKNHAERIPMGNTTNMLTSLAVSNGVFLIAGPIIERAGPRVFLTSIAISPTGMIMGKYRKIILNPGDKSLGISPGKTLEMISIKEKYGLLLENDLMYPEIARGLTVLGSTILLSYLRPEPAFDKRIKKILEARSIENNLPLIAVGGAVKSQDQILGETPSLIFDPSEGLLEEITMESKTGGSTRLGDEDKVILLELQNYVPKTMSSQNTMILELIAMIYKSLKHSLDEGNKKKT